MREIIEATSIEQIQQAWQKHKLKIYLSYFRPRQQYAVFRRFQGMVIINRLSGIQHREDSDYHYLHVNGGENWHKLVEWSLSRIDGLENLALIPGCAGSAPIQNIGAYGVEFKDVCDYVDVLNLNTGEQFRLQANECEFGYRESIFSNIAMRRVM